MLGLNLPAFESKNTQLMTVFTKSRPRKDQSERSDLPCHMITDLISKFGDELGSKPAHAGLDNLIKFSR